MAATAAGTQLQPGMANANSSGSGGIPSDFVKFVDDTRVQNAATIIVLQQDHTLGNALRCQLLKQPNVRFAGYKKPHPLEEKIEIKVHTDGVVKPEQAAKDSC